MQHKTNFIILQNNETPLDQNNLLREEKNSRECRERQKKMFSGESVSSKLEKKLLTHTLTEDV
tara:strand:- start:234 stop:422 length:189 start_codon:yes stop_codon:yes gene_type:complete